ncbi:hypothetical protein D9M71_225970 [compost metagenome]
MPVEQRVAEDQPVVLLVVLQGHVATLALQVGRARAEQDAVLHQRLGDDAGQVGGTVAQGEIAAAFHQVDIGIAQFHFQVHLRMVAHEAAAHPGEEGRAERRRRGDVQAAAQFVLQLLDALAGQAQLHQRLARAFQVEMTGFGQRHPSGGALEQPRAQLILQLRHGLGQGGRRPPQLLGGAAEIAVLGGGDEHGQGAQFVHRSIPDRHRSCAGDGILQSPPVV